MINRELKVGDKLKLIKDYRKFKIYEIYTIAEVRFCWVWLNGNSAAIHIDDLNECFELIEQSPEQTLFNQKNNEAKRFNLGKPRFDLLPQFAIKAIVDVFTKGAEKYDDNNWKKGMAWSKCIASLKRHIAKFESGHDLDEEDGLPHLAHAAVNCMFLLEYNRLCPMKDDRELKFLHPLRIGLDIDEVICDFVNGANEKWGISANPQFWKYSYSLDNKLQPSNELDNFYLNLKPLIKPSELEFEPVCYITHRPVSKEITEQWIEMNGFPCVPVYSTSDKVAAAKEARLDVFIDDSYDNFVNMTNGGIFTLLLTKEYNKKYDVGMRRIEKLNDVVERMDYFK